MQSMSENTPHTGAEGGATRTCAVCRASRSPEELVRLRERGGVAFVDGPSGGRGVWVCARRSCLEKADGRVLARGFKQPVKVPDEPGGLCGVVERVAAQKVLELLGLARRQGVLIVGQDRVASEPVGFVVAAIDASDRSLRAAGETARTFGSSAELGRATGLNGVSVLGIAPGSLARQAAYWLAVWYESRLAADGREARV